MRISDWSSDVCADQFYISAISILEIEQSILAEKRVDPVTGEILRAWFETDVLQAFADRIIAVDTEVAMRCAALHVPDPPSERARSEEHTSELQSLMRNSYTVFCLKIKNR